MINNVTIIIMVITPKIIISINAKIIKIIKLSRKKTLTKKKVKKTKIIIIVIALIIGKNQTKKKKTNNLNKRANNK